MFTGCGMPVTVYGVAMALERNPEAVAAMLEADWEIASHGLRWIDYQFVPLEVERSHFEEAIEIHTRVTGKRPLGWYTGRTSPNTRDLVKADGGFLYDSDSYADDLPYWEDAPHGPHLVVPYTLDANDMRFATAQGFNSGDQFYAYLRDSFGHAVPRGGGESEDDVGGAPLPAHGTARPRRGARPVPRPRGRARGCMGSPAHRYRAPLARALQAFMRRRRVGPWRMTHALP